MNIRLQKKMMRLSVHKKLQRFTASHIAHCEERIVQNILCRPEVQQADSFFIYVSYGREVPTKFLITQLLKQGKIVCVPKITGEGRMIPVQIASLQHVVRGQYGTLEPRAAVAYEKAIDIAFVPGLAFDGENNRLGRGGGYYDHFLAKNKHMQAIGFAWQQQYVRHVPTERHDQQLDNIFTFLYTRSPHISPQKL